MDRGDRRGGGIGFIDAPPASLDPDDPTVVGTGSNSDSPAGEGRTGVDATDDVCDQLRRDLDVSIGQTLDDLRANGMPSEYMPSRGELEDELSGALRANGCAGF